MLASNAEHLHSPAFDVIEVAKAALDPRHDPAKGGLPGAQRKGAHVFAIDRQQIERGKERPLPPEPEIVEVAGAVWVEAADFPI